MEENDKLPDELVLEILDRFSGAKELLITSLISHRFAYLVSKVRIVRVSRECFGHDASALTAHHTPGLVQIDEEGIQNILDKLIRPYNNLPTVSCLPPLSNYLPVLRFLSRLREIQHLTIEVPSFVDHLNILFKWGAHLEDGVLHSVSAIVKDRIVSGRVPWAGVISDATLRSDLLVQLSHHHPNLQSFTIIDPRRRGLNTVVTGPELAKLKGGRYDSRRLCNIKKISTTFPQLLLPSGERMPYAEIVLLKFVYTVVDQVEDDGTEASESDMEAFVSCFDHIDPEDSVFQEAAEEVYKLPRDNFDSEFVLILGHYFYH
ncbi:hypothetical protein RHMOL_Rhmol12G0025100 [Rhododendron molle]|uniref:Uncharacterized protein n=1 Tax=Rhododendron molle TaxID=49168 RepID=A0ACC0LDN7_RHOML|nr:hypothetical protein RHMOL_Rhmol12G0025100 [Rhododendron molle]